MSAREPWEAVLKPWADRHAELLRDLAVCCRESTDEELQDFLDATGYPNQTNCWFVTYEVAKIARDVAKSERYRRRRAGDVA